MSNFQASEPAAQRIRQLIQMPYQEYLQTAEWKARRDEVVERDGGRCRLCYSDKALQVHHRTYRRRGNEHPNDLTTLCAECHEHFHSRVTEQHLHAEWGVSSVPPTEEELEQRQKENQETMECMMLGLLLSLPKGYQETGIGQIVRPEDFSNLSRREIYHLMADHNAAFNGWLPSHLREEAQHCVTCLRENQRKYEIAGHSEITNNDIVQYGGRFKIEMLRKQNDGLEKLMNFADQAGDKEMVRKTRIGAAYILRQMREIDTFIRSEYRDQRTKVEEGPAAWEGRLAEIAKRRQEEK